MKKFKPFVFALCAVILAGATIMDTVAYMTDTASAVNTFAVGTVDIRLDEAEVDENGNPTGGRTEIGNKYHLAPGHTYVKDPTMTVVKGSEDSYVRILVTINCYKELAAIFGEPFLLEELVEGWDKDVWLATDEIKINTDNNTATYEFRYYKSVKPSADTDLVLDALFDTITVPNNLTGDQLRTIAGLKITAEGHAIQKSGFSDAETAWKAVDKSE